MIKFFLKTMFLICVLVAIFNIKGIDRVEADTLQYGRTNANLNIRKGPSIYYKRIGLIPKGTKIKLISYKNGWYKIKYGNSTGYSCGKYIKKVSTTTSTKTNSTQLNASYKKTLKVKAYAYTGGGITATGTKARYGVIAVDPRVIPYGTKVYIKELGRTFTAEDCGGGIKGNKIDIYMNTETACRNWGVRSLTIYIK